MTKKTNLFIFMLAISCGVLAANLYYAQPIVQFIAQDLHIPSNLSGLLTTFTQIGYGLGLLFIVPMADLYKSKKIILTLITLTIFALIGMLLTESGIIFIVFTTIIGIGACAAQLLVPLTARLVPANETGKYVGKVMSGLLMGIMLARPVAISVSGAFGWKIVFVLSVIMLIIILLLMLKCLPNYDAIDTTSMSYTALIASMWNVLLQTPLLQQRAFYHACLFAAFSLYWTVLPIFLRALSFSHTEIALIGFAAVAGALATPYIGALADKGYISSLTNSSMLLVCFSIVLLFFVQDHSFLSVTLLILSGISLDIGVAGNLVVGQKVIFQLQANSRNRLNGLYMSIFFLGGAFGSWIASYTYYAFNVDVVLLIGAAFPCLALIVHAAHYYSSKRSNTIHKHSNMS